LAHEFNEAIVADQSGESAAQMWTDILGVEAFEGAVVRELKGDSDREDFAQAQRSLFDALAGAGGQTKSVELGFKDLAEIVNEKSGRIS
jgi:hypothetical protein